MYEFNPDGSIKLPDHVVKKKEKEGHRLQNQMCILIKREVVNDKSPKKCMLHIKLSERFTDNRFIDTVFKYFNDSSEVPSKLMKLNDKEFDVEIGTCFSRCRDCNSLVSRYRDHLDGDVIDNKGSCTFKGFDREFCYEDYFD